METEEITNAIIGSVTIDKGDRNLLTVWLHLEFGAGGQGFGGYALYLPKDFTHAAIKGDFAGHFLFRCMDIAGVESWDKMKGKAIRIKRGRGLGGTISAIGHITKNDWFCPSEDFKRMSDEA